MATPKKKPSSKAKTSAKKKPVASKKKVLKKSVAKKKTTAAKKSTVAARKKAITKKRVRKTTTKKAVDKAMNKPDKPRRWWSVLTFGVVAVGIALGGYLAANPALLDQLQANLVAQQNTDDSSEAVEEVDYSGGILLAWDLEGENELKLFDIFRTVFPETDLVTVSYDSEKGKSLISELGVKELPAIYYAKESFEGETLSEVVKDLFTLNNDYYGLNVSLVNPTGQWHIGGALNTGGAVTVGNTDAPLTVVSYSDPKCQHCRVDAQNNLKKWEGLVDEGIVKIHFMDLPQSADAYYHAVALSCVGELQPAEYLGFRAELFNKANLSKNYTNRLLKRMDIDYEKNCKEDDTKKMLRKRLKNAEKDGITGVPAIYVHRSEEDMATRITGAKDFSEYQSVMDSLMAGEEQEAVEEETSESTEQ
jgi:protein-disulfide isomerase